MSLIHDLAPQANLGSYTIVGLLGRGRFGSTHLALQHGGAGLPLKVALKLLGLDPQLALQDREVIDLVMEEVGISGQLQHPNVVGILELGWAPSGVPYIVTEYVGGPSIDAIAPRACDRPGRVERWCWILTCVLEGLVSAHADGIVHGLLTATDIRVRPDGIPKLLGLEGSLLRGIFEDRWSERSVRHLRYAPPESHQAGSRPSTASDVFSLGACAWEAFAGRPLFRDADLQSQKQATILPLQEIVSDVPGPVAVAIGRALHPDPAARPSAEALAAVFRSFAGGVQPRQVARWVESLFPVDEDDATTVFGPEPEALPGILARLDSPATLDRAGEDAEGETQPPGEPRRQHPAKAPPSVSEMPSPSGHSMGLRWVPLLLVVLLLAGGVAICAAGSLIL